MIRERERKSPSEGSRQKRDQKSGRKVGSERRENEKKRLGREKVIRERNK